MKKTLLIMTIISILLIGSVTSSFAKVNNQTSNSIEYNFNTDLDHFNVMFADLPADADRDNLYEINYGHKQIPIDGTNDYGIYISAHNRSDDLFSYIYKNIGNDLNLKPNTEYNFSIEFTMATNEPKAMMGSGGAPGESVTVKAGVVDKEPLPYVDNSNYLRMALDKGNQSVGGKDMPVVGDITKPDESTDNSYSYKTFTIDVKTTTDKDGNAYIVIGTDSGYEGLTSIYYSNINIKVQ